MNDFKNLVESLHTEIQSFETKQTKAASKRIRDLINQIQKTAVSAKKSLIASDANGYK